MSDIHFRPILNAFMLGALIACEAKSQTTEATNDKSVFVVKDKSKQIAFRNYANMSNTRQNLINQNTYMAMNTKARAYFMDTMGKMESIPATGQNSNLTSFNDTGARLIKASEWGIPDSGDDDKTVAKYLIRMVRLENNEILFETNKPACDEIVKNPAFRPESKIDSAMFHHISDGERLFNIKSIEAADGSPLHIIGIKQGDRYFWKIHVDTHPDGVAHMLEEVIAKMCIRHIPLLAHIFPDQKTPDPYKIGQLLEEHNINTDYYVFHVPSKKQASSPQREGKTKTPHTILADIAYSSLQ